MNPGHPFALPDRFRFGITTSGFQVEGGYNGPGEPANNWAEWERAGVVEPSGIALDFWHSYEEHFTRAASLGCDSFRLSVEWARVEPAPGEIDWGALERYAAVLSAAATSGLEPVVTLHHFTHPAWLGPDFWVGLDAPDIFAAWVELAVVRLRGHCQRWVTVNQPNVYAMSSYLTGAFPPGRRLATGAALRSLDHLLAAHVLADEVIHRLQPEARVATTSYPLPVYELDQLLLDVVLARRRGVSRSGVGPYLRQRRRDWYRAAVGVATPVTARPLRRLAASILPLEQAFPRTVAEVYRSPRRTSIDTVSVGYGDHPPSGPRLAAGHTEQPAGLEVRSRQATADGLAFEVAENGFCNRVVRGRPLPRGDGWDRPRYLRKNLASLVGAVDDGAEVTGYWHRSLADGYEWGSYQPRFGLFAVDRDRGCRWSALDAMGHDSAGAYRRLIAALRSGDRSVLSGAGLVPATS